MASESHEITQNRNSLPIASAVFALLCLGHTACTSTTPSIAHVHVGHAITGAHDTPAKEGYFVLAESRAQQALQLAQSAAAPSQSYTQIADRLTAVNQEVNLRSDYALSAALKEAASHITFAAESNDASENVKRSARAFEEAIQGVVFRTNLINLYSQDARISTTDAEAAQLAEEVRKLSVANIEGEDLDGDGFIGNQTREYGMRQLRRDLDALVTRENPPYTTVDRWYLFNLIRMPSGDWLFRRRDSGNSQGY